MRLSNQLREDAGKHPAWPDFRARVLDNKELKDAIRYTKSIAVAWAVFKAAYPNE